MVRSSCRKNLDYSIGPPGNKRVLFPSAGVPDGSPSPLRVGDRGQVALGPLITVCWTQRRSPSILNVRITVGGTTPHVRHRRLALDLGGTARRPAGPRPHAGHHGAPRAGRGRPVAVAAARGRPGVPPAGDRRPLGDREPADDERGRHASRWSSTARSTTTSRCARS